MVWVRVRCGFGGWVGGNLAAVSAIQHTPTLTPTPTPTLAAVSAFQRRAHARRNRLGLRRMRNDFNGISFTGASAI